MLCYIDEKIEDLNHTDTKNTIYPVFSLARFATFGWFAFKEGGMKVNFYATLRQMAGQKTVDLDLPAGATLQDALAAVLAICPGVRSHLVDSQGELRGHIHLLLDRQDVHFLPQGMNTPVQPVSEVDLYPPIGGG